jgi:hypothetical protein
MPSRTALLAPLALLVLACSEASTDDFILYKAVPTEMEGRLRAGTLLVTRGGRALWVEHSSAGEVALAEGKVGDDVWDVLDDLIDDATSLPPSGPISDDGPGTFQVYARTDGSVTKILRDPSQDIEEEAGALRDRLEEVRRALSPPADPVGAATPLLDSPLSHVRGHGVVALLMLFRDERAGDEVRAGARAALRTHLLREGDPAIAERIKDALKKRRTPFLPDSGRK